LSIWGGEIANVGANIMSLPPMVDAPGDGDADTSETAIITGTSGDFVLPPPPPPPPFDPGMKVIDGATEAKPPVSITPDSGDTEGFSLPAPPPLPGMEPASGKAPGKKSKVDPAPAAATPASSGEFMLPPPPSLPGFEKK
ncbi:MAG TPA: hypothetical protein PKO06_21735, partial [Candidatus Ozemobacteraceae bacterium]|nr:hypothetical protein [Candidatus Ozemobacteraceae bacterium]